MRITLLFILCSIYFRIFSQENLTSTGDPSLSANNAQCIATSGKNVHVVWTNISGSINQIFYRKSVHEGHFWEDGIQLSQGWDDASHPSIAVHDQEVHVVWMDQRHGDNEIYYKRSLDNGENWGPDTRLTIDAGESTHPSLAISGQNIHVIWQDDRDGEFEIYYKRSTDGGTNWQQDMRLTDDQAIFIRPSITVYGNSVHAVWQGEYDDIFYKRSLDNGQLWSDNYQVNSSNSLAEQPTITLSETIIFVFWTDHRTGNGDIYMRRSVDNGNTWEDDFKIPQYENTAIHPRAASHGNYVQLLWIEFQFPSYWVVTDAFSTDGGVSWAGPGVYFLTQGASSTPFIALQDREVHSICIEKVHGFNDVYYFRDISGNPFLDNNVFEWGHGTGAAGRDVANDIVTDASGNVIITGSFENTVDFDNGPGNTSLVAAGNKDIFVVKYDSTGQLQWAKRTGGTDEDQANSIAVDQTGNIYTTGFFKGTSDFDPGSNSFPLISSGQGDIFISKLDPSGNFVSAVRMGGSGHDEGLSITVDKDGNILTTGSFTETGDFDPSNGTLTLISIGMTDMFLTKQDPSGNLLWSQSIGGVGTDVARGIVSDKDGYILLTGSFSDTVDFDPGANVQVLKSKGLTDIFVLKLDSTGQWQWSNGFGAEEDDEGKAITCDTSGAIYSTGYFEGRVDFDPDTSVFNLHAGGANNPYVLKLNRIGQFLWAGDFDGNRGEGIDIALDRFGHIYTIGNFSGGMDFDPGNQRQLFLISNYQSDVFISKLTNKGEYLWANQLSGYSSSTSTAFTMINSTDIYAGGYYFGNLDLDPTLGIELAESAGNADFFLTKIHHCQVGPPPLDIIACGNMTSPDGEELWYQSGTYEDILRTADGCDSVIIVHLTILLNEMSRDTIVACDFYTSPQGHIWTQSGNYILHFLNAEGCDSTVRYNLTIVHETEVNVIATACEQYTTPDGTQTWTTSGSYEQVFVNIGGCDSIITYHLTILHSTEDEIVTTACDQYTTPDGTETYTTSGIYQQEFMNADGCDSTVTYHLTILQDTEYATEVTSCESYTTPDGLNTWDISGVYDYTIPNVAGCDSNITLDLTIIDIDNSVMSGTATLEANQTGAVYQWIDCSTGAIIPGEISQTFSPSVSGNYGVIIEFNGCTDTSSCYPVNIVGVHENEKMEDIKIYPNPANDFFYIDLGREVPAVEIEILSVDGRVLEANSFYGKELIKLETGLPEGFYFVRIKTNGERVVKRIVLL